MGAVGKAGRLSQLREAVRIKGRKLVPQFSYQRVFPALDATFEGARGEFVTAWPSTAGSERW